MSDELITLILGATAHMSPADVAERITDTEKTGYTLVSTYTATGFAETEEGMVPKEIVCGVFRKVREHWGAATPSNPFKPEVKTFG